MGFEYGYTCGEIDREIQWNKDLVKQMMIDLLDEACPLLNESSKERIANEHLDNNKDHINQAFETVRKLNEDMRDEADKQIVHLEGEIEDLKSQVEELQGELDECE